MNFVKKDFGQKNFKSNNLIATHSKNQGKIEAELIIKLQEEASTVNYLENKVNPCFGEF